MFKTVKTNLIIVALAFTPPIAEAAGETLVPAVSEKIVQIDSTDGVVLVGTLLLPAGSIARNTILIRTPYSRRQHLLEARYWAQCGYAVVVQDTRGKFDSTGEYLPFINEYIDGVATLDWIVDQPWSNGRVGMWGSSYLAFCQLVLASAHHPALRSIIPISGWLHDTNQIEHGGANHIMLSIPWILHEESQTRRPIVDVELDDLFAYLPLMEVFQSIGLESKIWREEYDFASLDVFSAENISIPALHMTGWNDFVATAALEVYRQARGGVAGDNQKLVVGPWIHDQFYTTFTSVGDEDFGPESAMGRERLMQLARQWFDLTLKPAQPALSDWPDARLFVMGANRWRNYGTWPPTEARSHNLYLGSFGNANTLGGDGYLVDYAPEVTRQDTFRFDPMNPVPTYGGANFHFLMHLAGVKDQREIEMREDVLVYTSAPLPDELQISGPVQVVLHAATEGVDTDFTAKLVSVRPDGYARIINEGIVRACYRNGTTERQMLEPGTIYELVIELGATSLVIPAGERIRVEISSSNFPKYDRNPNTGEDALRARTLRPVNQQVFHGGKYGSRLVLPVVPNNLPNP